MEKDQDLIFNSADEACQYLANITNKTIKIAIIDQAFDGILNDSTRSI